MILVLRTDKPEAEVGFYDQDGTKLTFEVWQAHRELSSTILTKISSQMKVLNVEWAQITGIVYFEGPGSFTGLRIGATVANAIASTNSIQVANAGTDEWIQIGLVQLREGRGGPLAIPAYGAEAHITLPKK
jgi:tRNA threonylcarbamoyladenosine biosynthesis protein TsaB